MKQSDKILMVCSEGENDFGEITETLGWKKGATAAAINRLIEGGFLKKTRRGFYITTNSGLERIKQNIKKKPDEPDTADIIVNGAVALFTTYPHYDIIKTLKYEKEARTSSERTKELRDVIKRIYLETVGNITFGHADADFVQSVWRYHQRPVCDCGFNFERAYKYHATEINKLAGEIELVQKLDKKSLFKNLRWESFPEIERYRKNFGLTTTYTEPEILDN